MFQKDISPFQYHGLIRCHRFRALPMAERGASVFGAGSSASYYKCVWKYDAIGADDVEAVRFTLYKFTINN